MYCSFIFMSLNVISVPIWLYIIINIRHALESTQSAEGRVRILYATCERCTLGIVRIIIIGKVHNATAAAACKLHCIIISQYVQSVCLFLLSGTALYGWKKFNNKRLFLFLQFFFPRLLIERAHACTVESRRW